METVTQIRNIKRFFIIRVIIIYYPNLFLQTLQTLKNLIRKINNYQIEVFLKHFKK